MKTPKKMIAEHERRHPPKFIGGTRFYTYVRPRSNGQATIEIWAAVTDRRKNPKLHAKWVMRFYTDNDICDTRDLLFYSSWSTMSNDHFVVDWTEVGGMSQTNYFSMTYREDEKGKIIREHINDEDAMDARIPLATMLNDFSDTDYRYCAYTPECGINLRKYLALYRINHKVELLTKARLFHLITENFLDTMDAFPDLGRYIARHMERAKSVSAWRITKDYTMSARVGKDYKAYMADVERRKHEALMRAAERKVNARIKEQSIHDKKIRKLYNQVKGICGAYESYDVIVPACAKEMVIEGERMHNCIGKIHPPMVASGDELCVFLHRNGKPFIDISISLHTFEVTECRLVCNQPTNELQKRIASNIAKKVESIMKTKVA